MRTPEQAPAPARGTPCVPRRLAALWLVLVIQAGLAATASSAQATGPKPAEAAATAINPQGVVNLDGPWRFHLGDDPRWSDPAFDDAAWPEVTLNQPLSEQGVSPYTGYAWYRLHLHKEQAAALEGSAAIQSLDLLVVDNSVGQLAIYIDGVEAGHTRGMTGAPVMYQSPSVIAHLLPANKAGERVLAIRSWAGDGVTVQRGLVEGVDLGSPDEIAGRLSFMTDRAWNRLITPDLFLILLYLGTGGLAGALYLAQRNHPEYMWLALLCPALTLVGGSEIVFNLGTISLPVFSLLNLIASSLFIAVTLEFVLHLTGGEYRRTVRGAQLFQLLLPAAWWLHWRQAYEYLSLAAEVIFSVLVTVLLLKAWRKGRSDAGVMVIPFSLAAAGDSVDSLVNYAVGKRWISSGYAHFRLRLGPIEFSMGAVTIAVFLSSLVAVVLYRFLRISQDEQRNSAELIAAQKVQALLIPTELPSNRNFMLESAYLPANGVGGDFFQAHLLGDESLLIVVGDVSGKGLQAALNSSTLVGALRNELSQDPAVILDHLNRVLIGAVPSPGAVPELDTAPCFATCLCARIFPDGRMAIANAGHLSPYCDGRELELMPNLPLGVIAGIRYEQSSFQLRPGERLVFLSDGVVEAANPQGELFGFDRTRQVSNEPARYIAQTARRFGQNDDITVVSLYFAGRAAQDASREAAQAI